MELARNVLGEERPNVLNLLVRYRERVARGADEANNASGLQHN